MKITTFSKLHVNLNLFGAGHCYHNSGLNILLFSLKKSFQTPLNCWFSFKAKVISLLGEFGRSNQNISMKQCFWHITSLYADQITVNSETFGCQLGQISTYIPCTLGSSIKSKPTCISPVLPEVLSAGTVCALLSCLSRLSFCNLTSSLLCNSLANSYKQYLVHIYIDISVLYSFTNSIYFYGWCDV